MIGTVKVFEVSPAAKLNVRTTVAKSHRPKAAPFFAAQLTVKVSVSVVLKSMVATPVVSPVRITLIVALPSASLTE
jgi:hypothetical protein